MGNLALACAPCNLSKWAKTPKEWLDTQSYNSYTKRRRLMERPPS